MLYIKSIKKLLIYVLIKNISLLVISVCREANPSQGYWDPVVSLTVSLTKEHMLQM